MSKVFKRVGISGFATILALVFSVGMVFVAMYQPTQASAESLSGACTVCNGSCGSTGCSYSCGDDSNETCHKYQTRFMCDGRLETACNEHTGESIKFVPNYADSKYWCKTYQFDSNADNGAYSVVYVGDKGKTCTHRGGQPQQCDPKDLDWNCENTTPPSGGGGNRKPVCESLSISKRNVTSIDETITITLRGSDPDNTPKSLKLYAAAGGQTNKNSGDYSCTFKSVSDPDYSFYCGGEKVWSLIGEKSDTKTYTLTTTFRELEESINKLPMAYNGKLREKGINITANIVGSYSNDLCSSNIARFSGNGAYYTEGTWKETCHGGCNQVITYTPIAKPKEPKACNETCIPGGCAGSNTCIEGVCRNASCLDDEDCTCEISPSEARCGDNKCNQDSETCENNVACDGGATVSCRSDCTYCGDGLLNGDEQCDFNGELDKGVVCSNECKLVNTHSPVDTGGRSGWIYIVLGFTVLAAGVTTLWAVVPMKRKLG